MSEQTCTECGKQLVPFVKTDKFCLLSYDLTPKQQTNIHRRD